MVDKSRQDQSLLSMSSSHPPLIELRGIRKRYGGGATQQPDSQRSYMVLTCRFMPENLLLLVGASGSGKSTLMNILGCLDRPCDGCYFFNGQDVAQFDAEKLAWLRRKALWFRIPRLSFDCY